MLFPPINFKHTLNMHMPNLLASFVDNNFEDNFGLIADSMKASMYQNAPHLFKRLEFDNDDNFMEPLFLLKVAYDPMPKFSYEQLVFGYIDDKLKPEEIKVLSSNKGVVYLPRLGYLKTTAFSSVIDLLYHAESGQIQLRVDGKEIGYEFVPAKFISESHIEIVQFNNPLNDDNFGTKDNPQVVDIESGYKDHSTHVEKAMNIIKNEYPWYYSYIEKAVKKIVVFYNDEVRSFASKTTTGISYISARKEYNEVFFMEDIVHQCAHNILYVVTVQMDEYFATEAKKGLINQFNKNENDYRTIYSAYHGMFSLVNICTLFSSVFKKDIFDGQKKYEITGRLADNLKRLGKNINDVKYREAYTEKGWELLIAIEDRYNTLLAEHQVLLDKYDTSRQPYVFDYGIFLEDNPL